VQFTVALIIKRMTAYVLVTWYIMFVVVTDPLTFKGFAGFPGQGRIDTGSKPELVISAT